MTPIFLFKLGGDFNTSSPDSTKPVLNNFSLSPDTVNTTESLHISVNATDNDSGVYKANVKMSNPHSLVRSYSLSAFENGTAAKNVTAPDVETTFSVDIEVFDKAGNKALFLDVGELRVK